MQRLSVTPRPNWRSTLESQGMNFYEEDGDLYWDESALYAFSPDEIERLEAATYALDTMCLAAVEHAIERRMLPLFDIPAHLHEWIERSWEQDERTIYGRFDFAFSGGEPKLLEYNADTPTALLEAAVVQWFWLQDWQQTPEAQRLLQGRGASTWDQFNTLHERLVEAWKPFAGQDVAFTGMSESLEDFSTVAYLQEAAAQAGVDARWIRLEDIGWSASKGAFVDKQERAMPRIFKLYPWEWMARESFSKYLPGSKTRWLEAPWKMLLSNKALLPLLWQMFPDSPYLLRAQHAPWDGAWVSKPFLSREGSNVTINLSGQVLASTDGPYDGRQIYQEYVPLQRFAGNYAIVGSWMVNGWAAGIGIREDSSMITGNDSRFVPHAFWSHEPHVLAEE